jgi:hypothetical protein
MSAMVDLRGQMGGFRELFYVVLAEKEGGIFFVNLTFPFPNGPYCAVVAHFEYSF